MKNKIVLNRQRRKQKIKIDMHNLINTVMNINDNKKVPKIVKKELERSFQKVDFSNDFLKRSIEPKSAISFFRYVEFFAPYSYEQQLLIDIDDSYNLTLRIKAKKNYFLSLIFKKNGVVDFLSLDMAQIIRADESPFYLRGSIETSGNFDNAYKIKRLLAILNCEDAEDSHNIRGSRIVSYRERLDIVSNISENSDAILPPQKVLTY